MRFKYVGPVDEVEVLVRVKRGEVIDVPASVAGRPYSEERDPDTDEVLSRDLGEGLLAQPSLWEPQAEPEVVLDDLTIAELKAVAEREQIDLGDATKKADIVAVIAAAEKKES